jgi:hypothetical protein
LDWPFLKMIASPTYDLLPDWKIRGAVPIIE